MYIWYIYIWYIYIYIYDIYMIYIYMIYIYMIYIYIWYIYIYDIYIYMIYIYDIYIWYIYMIYIYISYICIMSIYLKIADIFITRLQVPLGARHPHAISLQRWATQFAGGSLSLARPWRFVLLGRVSGGWWSPVTNYIFKKKDMNWGRMITRLRSKWHPPNRRQNRKQNWCEQRGAKRFLEFDKDQHADFSRSQ